MSASNAVLPSDNPPVVANGGFESGMTSWTAGGARTPTVSTTVAHTGTSSALLGALAPPEPLGDSWVQQTITVPSGTSSLTFWYRPVTSDSSCSGSACVYDWQTAQVRNTAGATLATIFKLNSNSQTWTPVTFDLTPYAGQTVVLWFNVHEEGSTAPADPTSMYLDDVSVTVAPPTAPAAPTGVVASAGNASATVSWSAPSSGGSPITRYTVTPFVGGTAQTSTTVTGTPPPTSVTINGLTNGTSYTFTVTATNAIGTGPASAASNPVVPSANPPVVANGGFESGLTSWTAGGVKTPTISTTVAHSGANAAVLGSTGSPEPLGDSWVQQTISVPTGTPTLTFWYRPVTSDSTCSGSSCLYDWQEAQVRTSAGATLATIFKLNANSQTWTQVTFDMTPYAGQTVVLWFNVHQDGSRAPADPTSMYLDDVSVA